MNCYNITVEAPPDPKDVQTLTDVLNAFATPFAGVAGFQTIGVFLRNDKGALVGGLWAYINWNWLNICIFWLPEDVRRRGFGTRMLARVEEEARLRGCFYVHLDTFSFEAKPFYEKFGYEVFATLEDYPPGHQRFFMKKSLS